MKTGEPGEDNNIVYPEMNCPLPDTKKCIKCAAGPRGTILFQN